MKKRLLSLTLIAALCLSLFPTDAAPALAAAPSGQEIYVGGQNVTSGGYWTTDSDGNVTNAGATQPSDNYIHYDEENNVLTLHNTTIKKGLDYSEGIQGGTYIPGSAIGVLNLNGDAELTITLAGTNTIEDVNTGIFVLAHSSYTGDASLTITGSGSLTASGNINGINVQSNSGDATLTIQSADVTLTSNSGNGVTVQAGSTNSSGEHTITLSVEGGSLTASGSTGISFDSASSYTVSATNLTVSNNAIVRANYVGSNISNVDLQIGKGNNSSGGIVFDGDEGTVYGNVTLQKDLTIGEGESLTLAENASLSPGGHNVIVDGGTLDEGLAEDLGDSVKYTPTITTTTLPNGTEGETYNQTLAATGTTPITWSITTGSLPAGLTLAENTGVISGNPSTSGTSTFTVTATNQGGSDSKQLTLTIEAATNVTVESVSLDKTTLELTEGNTATLTATITPDNATNKGLLWRINNTDIIKFHEGATANNSQIISAVSPGITTITVAATDGSGVSATCTVTVNAATTITTQPQSVSVTEGQSATFSVTATGDNLRYQWQINSGNGWSDITGATDASYTIDRTTTAMSGNQYRCIVTGDGGEVTSDAAMLTVNDRPTIPPVTPPSVSEETIDAINDAEPGETVSVAFEDGDTTLDAEVFETLAGQDITLKIALEGGVTWTVNGQDIPADANLDDLDLGVEMDSDGIPVDVINTITGERDTVQMTLAHDGDFGFTMTLTAPLGAENAGYWANLYHYNEATARMDFETAVLIDDDGNAALPLSHASQYAIVIDDHSHATIDLPFSDVSAGDWFYDPVCYVYAGGLMTGVSDTAFAPEATTTRAMIVSMLARLENVTSADSAGFTDVAASDWYATAVNWAASEGIVGGFGDGTFQPNAAITREQMASILYRYAEYKGLDVSARTDLSHYSDQPSVWAEDVMQWAVAEGLLAGVTDDQLQPQGQATRAQVAAILQRFLENVCA